MRVLFLHQNFPAQFVHIAGALKRAGHDVRAIKEGHDSRPEIVPTVRYTHSSPSALDQIPMLARSFAERVRRGETVAKTMLALRGGGFEPDLVVGHFGWGETLFVKDVWPGTKLIVYAEYFYSAEGSDVDFDPEFIDSTSIPEAFLRRAAVRTRNAAILLALQSADFAVTSTDWQRSRFPIELQGRISVLHEGIDTKRVAPDPEASLRLSSHGRQVIFRTGDEVITFVNRNLEPYRGYHVFMRALPSILAERRGAHAVIVGGDGVSYGRPPPAGQTWKAIFLNEVRDRLPMDRVHFVGRLPYRDFIRLMQISAAHIYLTYPFVLSWSMLEAMSAGALVLASQTGPVVEVIEHKKNGVLFDFFRPEELAAAATDALATPSRYQRVREAARRTMKHKFDLNTICLPGWASLVEAALLGPAGSGGSAS